jgi:predicted dehydrogenase
MSAKRRTFLKAAAAAGFGFHLVPRHVLGGEGGVSPNSKLNIAGIGAGGQAAADLKSMPDENIVALCDVDERRAEMFKLRPEAKRYRDFRKMIEEMGDKIDAVVVGTPDHTHTIAAMAAMKAGKHVYCEKPLAHSVAEVRALRREARERKLITQVGNQGHSSDSIRVLCEWIWDGAIGNVTEVHAYCNIFRDTYSQHHRLEQVLKEQPEVPKELDWDLWQGPVAKRPYHPAYAPWAWRGWMPYGSGALGDWVCHVIDPVFWALDLDMPVAVQAETDGYDPIKHVDLYPQGAQVSYEFAAKGSRGPVKLVWYDGSRRAPRPEELEADRNIGDVGAVVVGDKGKILYGSHGAGGCRLIPEAKMKDYKRPEPKIPRVRGGHQRDWLDAVREGRQAGSPFEYGGRLSELGLLGVVAIRMTGQKVQYDEQAMRFTNCDDANKWLTPVYQNGWAL